MPPDPERPFDLVGAILSAVGMFFVVLGILQADSNGSLMVVFLAVGAAFLAGFFLYIRSRERAGKEALLSTGLFKNRTSNLGLATQNAQWLILMGTSFVVAVYLQEVRGYNAIETGAIFTAATLGLLVTSFGAERFSRKRTQKALILAGFAGTIAGIGLLIGLVAAWSSVVAFVPGLLLIGLGLGLMLTPSVNLVQSSFPEEQQGEISGLSRSVSNLGSTFGTAIAGTILVSGLTTGAYALAMASLGGRRGPRSHRGARPSGPARAEGRCRGSTPVTTAAETAPSARASGAMLVLFTLASGQFLMTLDSSVMNVSIATVAKDVGTTVTGIQGAITAYTLVMAALMITGAKIGAIIGRKRAFAIGCVIYGCGSFTTSIAQSLPVLLFGWSFLEGVGAALIMPAIVALVAGNFPAERRPAAYGLVAAAGAVAVAVGPLIGGFCTTYFSWRWVFAGEVIVVIAILLLTRRIADAPVEERPQLDVVGAVLSALGLGMIVFGVLRSSEWGWIQPKADAPSWAGLSPTIWLVIGGLFVIWVFFRWQARRESHGQEPLVRTAMLRNKQLTGGLTMFFFQFLIQAGFFFVVPLFLSVALGLSAIDTGIRLLPLSVTLLAAAIGIPKLFPQVSPRLVVRLGLLSLLAGTVVLLGGLDAGGGRGDRVRADAARRARDRGARLAARGRHGLGGAGRPEPRGRRGPEHDDEPRRLAGYGAGRLAADRDTDVVVPHERAAEPGDPREREEQAQVELAGGIPFISDADLETALEEAGATSATTDAAVDANADARLDGLRSALAILAVLAVLALFLAQTIPTRPPGVVERRE